MQKSRERFNFFVPIEIEKAGKSGEDMRIKGIASTADKDVQGETLLPSGFDLNRFLTQGFLNWNHTAKSDPSSIIGEPVKAQVTKDNKLYIEGVLYKDAPLAKKVWNLAKTLEKSGSSRRLGFSIEGVATERDFVNPKIVRKAEITGCAITPTPVNKNTIMEIIKGEVDNPFVDYEYDAIEKGGVDVILEGVNESSNELYQVDKNFNIICKSMDSVTISPITLEDLEGVKRISKSIEVLSQAMKEGKLSDDQMEKFKKAVDRIKSLQDIL